MEIINDTDCMVGLWRIKGRQYLARETDATLIDCSYTETVEYVRL